MKIFNSILIITIIFVMPSLGFALDKSPVRLLRDPFKQPAFVSLKKSKTASESVKNVKKTIAKVVAVKLKLRATLVADQDSMANVNGVLLKLGETIKGYRLLQIRKNEVVFEKNGRKKIISMEDANSQDNNVESELKK